MVQFLQGFGVSTYFFLALQLPSYTYQKIESDENTDRNNKHKEEDKDSISTRFRKVDTVTNRTKYRILMGGHMLSPNCELYNILIQNFKGAVQM